MQDANIPKFLSFDVPLFNGIIEDLFPNVVIPKRNQDQLINKLKTKCDQQNIIPTPNFIEKCLQFHETLKVRFGVMLVGPPMGSKTCIVKTLLDQFPIVVNPKAVSLA
jgi:dynein heavy chain, axonemal